MDRRTLFLTAGAICLGPFADHASRRDGGGRRRGLLENPGIQLFTLRTLMAQDLPGTLAAVAEIGYREVEFAGYFGRAPAEIRRLLDRHGLVAPAGHLPLEALRQDPDRVLDFARAVGHQYAVVASVPAPERSGPDAWRRIADEFNRLGERVRAAGLRFAYHNHDVEFLGAGGPLPFDVLLQHTDPQLVWFELDLYWITKAGHDAASYLARAPGRYRLVHVKDMDATPRRAMTDPGTGILDFATLLPKARDAGVRHWFVEHDSPPDPLATARAGFAVLSRIAL